MEPVHGRLGMPGSVAAAGAAHRAHQAAAPELGEELLQVGQRDLLALCDLGQRYRSHVLVHREVQHRGHGVTFATGTPISNTMVEMYTMQRFLDPAGLRDRGIEHFDAWAATFGEVIDTLESAFRDQASGAAFTNPRNRLRLQRVGTGVHLCRPMHHRLDILGR